MEGSLWKGDRIEIPHEGWTLVLRVDSGDADSSFESTRLSAQIEPLRTGKLLLWLTRDWPGQKLLRVVRLLGVHEARIPGLVDQCLVLTFDIELARCVFGDPELQEWINDQSALYLLIGCIPRSSRSIDNEIVAAVPGIVDDINRLKSLIAFTRHTIETLARCGAIQAARSS